MTATFGLLKDIQLDHDVNEKVYNFLFENGEHYITDDRRLSSGSYDSRESLDADKPAGVAEWSPFIEEEENKSKEVTNDTFWLGQCVTATFSSLEYFLLCRGLKWVLLRRKASDEQFFDCETTKKVEKKTTEEDKSYITQCTLFALGSTRQSELVDCPIVVIGTSTGTVLFYTENGKMLFEESFATNSPILRISMDYSEDGQLFTVVTGSDIFAINAFSLHSNLLQSKLAIAKGEKTAAQLSETIELELTRFKIEDKASIKDAIFTGTQHPSAFDQYVRASLEDYNSVVDRAAPNYSTFFVHTDKMFATFSWFPEGEDSNLWSDTVYKLANSFIPHFGLRKFLGINNGPQRKSALLRTSLKAMNRSTLNDNREILRMVKAPRPRPWIAVVDNLARVLIMDWKMRHVMRWFKGYRDAQVAFITASHEGSTVIFLVIFAPRRSLLEIWPLMRGARIAAQTVDPNGILLEGGTTAVICGKRDLRQPSNAYFVDSQGNFFRINVPYHLAFMESDNREHDQLVLAKISPSSTSFNVEEFLELYSSLHNASSKRQAFLKVISSCSESHLQRIFSELKKEESLENFDDAQKKSFEEIIKRGEAILHVYNLIKESFTKRPNAEEELDIPLSKENVDLVKKHLEIGEQENTACPPVECLITTINWTSEYTNILEKNIPDHDILQICQLIFEPIFTKSMDIKYFVDQVLSRIPFTGQTIASLFSHNILHGKEKIGRKFTAIIQFLEYLAKNDEELLAHFEKNAVESPNVSRGLLFSAAIWIVKVKIQEAKKKELEKAEGKEESEDEKKDEEEAEWEAFDPMMEHYDCTLLAMHSVWLLSCVRYGVTFSKMMAVGGGYFREQIASWVAEKQLTCEEFEEILVEDKALKELSELIPKVLEENCLFADVGWELMSYWFKSKMENISLLKESIRFIQKIKNNRLRHGVAKLVWEKFLLESVKTLSSVVEKTGRSPKEREAKQYLQMHDRHMEVFLEGCCHVLDVLWQSVKDMYVLPATVVDHFLEIAFSHPPSCITKVGTKRDSLVHIAIVQQAVNYHLVIHHLHLLKVYILVIRSGIRIRPLTTVFCAIGQRAFFHPLDSHPLIPLEKVDDGTLENRHKFLSKVIEGGSEEDRKMAREMASEWALTVDQIALVEALAHFRQGDDNRGAKEISSIISSHLGSKLAKLLAARMLRLADAKKTILTATHMRILQDIAGDEMGRVEWNGDWMDSVESLSKIMKSLTFPPEATTLFVKIMSIATQYWGF